MTYFEDDQPCSYFNSFRPPFHEVLRAVGWLEGDRPYARGAVSSAFRSKLAELLIQPWQPSLFLGWHDCSICDPPALCEKPAVGRLNLFVPGHQVAYVAPDLIAHYIDEHGYQPPQAFQQAVLACPPMGSEEYVRRLSLVGFEPDVVERPPRLQIHYKPGEIYLQAGSVFYPAEGWTDQPDVVLEWWMRNLLFRGGVMRNRFTEGDYALVVEHDGDRAWISFAGISMGMPWSEYVRELLRVVEAYVEAELGEDPAVRGGWERAMDEARREWL